MQGMDGTLKLTSPAFHENGVMPALYTCDGSEAQPPLMIDGAPEGTQSFLLVMHDPDIPAAVKESRGIESFDHWVLYAIPANTREIEPGVGVSGKNSVGKTGYVGPCPPPQYDPREHRYVFTLYALSGNLSFAESPTAAEVRAAAEPLTLARAQLVVRYSRA